MNYTQLYKQATMHKVASDEQIYKVAKLLKKAEDAGIGSWLSNPHESITFTSGPRLIDVKLSAKRHEGTSPNSYFSQLQRKNPEIGLPVRDGNGQSERSLIPNRAINRARVRNSNTASDQFGLPRDTPMYNKILQFGRKVGKTKLDAWKNTGRVPSLMSEAQRKEFDQMTKDIPLLKGQTEDSRRQQFYNSLSNANRNQRFSNIG